MRTPNFMWTSGCGLMNPYLSMGSIFVINIFVTGTYVLLDAYVFGPGSMF